MRGDDTQDEALTRSREVVERRSREATDRVFAKLRYRESPDPADLETCSTEALECFKLAFSEELRDREAAYKQAVAAHEQAASARAEAAAQMEHDARLQAVILSVAAALGDSGSGGVTLTYAHSEGEWFWTCHVAAVRRPHGRGQRVVRHSLSGHGDTPEAAGAEVMRKVAIPGYLDILNESVRHGRVHSHE